MGSGHGDKRLGISGISLTRKSLVHFPNLLTSLPATAGHAIEPSSMSTPLVSGLNPDRPSAASTPTQAVARRQYKQPALIPLPLPSILNWHHPRTGMHWIPSSITHMHCIPDIRQQERAATGSRGRDNNSANKRDSQQKIGKMLWSISCNPIRLNDGQKKRRERRLTSLQKPDLMQRCRRRSHCCK